MLQYIEYTNADGTTEQLSKLEAVKRKMDGFLDNLLQQLEENEKQKKPRKIAWKPRIYNKLESVLLSLECPMENALALKITAQELYACYNQYCKLCCWIEEKVGISYNKDKPEFCAFCGITGTAFSEFKTKGDPHQREAADDIDTRISNCIQIAMESSDIKSNAGQFRQTAKTPIGHSVQVTTAHEPVAVIPVTPNSFRSTAELMSNLAVLPDNERKQIGSGKK
ncbi:MAG: hypothetical protein NC131_01190 [Roseburia sp.]|nr:hypothetical protein [Roseburia sp.]